MDGANRFRGGRVPACLLAITGIVLLLGLWFGPGRAEAAPPAGFQETTAFSGLEFPTAVSVSPDGRFFVAEKSGIIKVFDNLSDTTPTTVADLRTEVHNFWDRGLLGMVLDPQFPADPYVYVLYTRDAMPGGTPPRWGTAGVSGDPCPSPPGPTGDGCVVTGRLARITVNGTFPPPITPLITDWCQQYPSHSTGDLGFGADGALYVSGGDGASFNFVDYGQDGNPLNPCGDPPGGVGATLTPPTAEGGALRSQDLRTPGDPTSLDGTVLRVNPETGAALPDNPFFGSGDANRDRIVSYGLRNPFKLTIRPGTSEPWTGETGWGTWEELNRTPDPLGGVENFGWPCYEGSNAGSARQSGYDGANLNLCETLYAPGEPNVVRPYFSYSHSAKVVSGESCPSGSSSVGGIDFYETGGFPNSYNGALFFADYSRDCMWAIRAGAGGLPDVAQLQAFNPGAANPVDIEVSPSGELFYVNYDGGQVRRIVYTAGNQPPVAALTANPQNGPAPLNVALSAAGSSDPDDAVGTLSFAWDADNDGAFDDGSGSTLNWTYAAGTHVARVRVSDPDGASDTESISIQANNTPPVAQIDAPTGPTTWAVDDEVGFSGSATDAQQTLPATAFDWQVIINHCPSNCHDHVAELIADKTSGSFTAPDHEYPSTLTIRLTVTDQGGLSDTEEVTIDPRTVDLTLDSAPDGLELGFNAETATAPFTRTVIDGSENSVSASGGQTLGGQTYDFGSWSDGGAAAHNITVDEDRTLTATFHDVTPPPAPQITDTDPDSPANDNQPEVKGTAGGDAATVEVFTNSSCSGTPANGGSVALFGGAGIPVTVNSDATTQLSARSRDAAGNASSCSTAVSYTEDSTAPAAPSLTGTSPASPANDNNPEVQGSAGGGATSVRVFASSNCTGTPVTGTPAQLAGAGHHRERPRRRDDPALGRQRRRRGQQVGLLVRHLLHRGLDRPRGPEPDRHLAGVTRERQQPRGPGQRRRRRHLGPGVRELELHRHAGHRHAGPARRGRDHRECPRRRDDPALGRQRRRRRQQVGLLVRHLLHRGLDRSGRADADRYGSGFAGQRQQPRGEGGRVGGHRRRQALHERIVLRLARGDGVGCGFQRGRDHGPGPAGRDHPALGQGDRRGRKRLGLLLFDRLHRGLDGAARAEPGWHGPRVSGQRQQPGDQRRRGRGRHRGHPVRERGLLGAARGNRHAGRAREQRDHDLGPGRLDHHHQRPLCGRGQHLPVLERDLLPRGLDPAGDGIRRGPARQGQVPAQEAAAGSGQGEGSEGALQLLGR